VWEGVSILPLARRLTGIAAQGLATRNALFYSRRAKLSTGMVLIFAPPGRPKSHVDTIPCELLIDKPDRNADNSGFPARIPCLFTCTSIWS